MEVRIGIENVQRELMIETSMSQQDIEAALTAALVAEAGVLTLPDEKGGQVLVPAGKIAYIDLGSSEPRRIGFR